MNYEKQTFVDGQVLTAECLNRMEGGIKQACEAAPPACPSADCSKVLSYGANGPEWVDMPQSGGGSGGASSLIVTASDETASHTAEQIAAHIAKGGVAYLFADSMYMPIIADDSGVAYAAFINSQGVCTVYVIYDGTTVARYEHEYVKQDQIDSITQWISEIADQIENGGASIDDTCVSADSTWSSQKIETALDGADDAIKKLNDAVFETVGGVSSNLFNPEAVEQVNQFDISWWQSPVIPCAVGDTIYVKKQYETSFEGLSFGIVLVGTQGEVAYPSLSTYKTFLVPTHANIPNLLGVKLRFRENLNTYESLNTIMVTVNEEPTEFSPWMGTVQTENRVQKNAEQIADLTTKVLSRWNGKNVLVFGDSISTDYYANYTKWATALKNSMGFNLFNYSVHGFGFVCGQGSAEQGEYNMINQIETANTELTAQGVSPDLIILFMGTNDFANKVPIGEAGDGTYLEMYSKDVYLTPKKDRTEITTFYGGVEHCMARIKQLWVNALVCVLTPLQRTNQTSATPGMALADYSNIIAETAKRFTFPVKDLYNEANFCPCNPYDREAKTYQFPEDNPNAGTYDGLHPNEAYCRDVLAPMIGRFIENI